MRGEERAETPDYEQAAREVGFHLTVGRVEHGRHVETRAAVKMKDGREGLQWEKRTSGQAERSEGQLVGM